MLWDTSDDSWAEMCTGIEADSRWSRADHFVLKDETRGVLSTEHSSPHFSSYLLSAMRLSGTLEMSAEFSK